MQDILGLSRAVVRRYAEHDVLTFAAAIAYKVLYAIIPLLLFGLGLAGGLGYDERWTREWAPTVKDAVSPRVFPVVDEAARRVLQRAADVLDDRRVGARRVDGVERRTRDHGCVRPHLSEPHSKRSFVERIVVSLALGLGVAVLVLAARACVTLVPLPGWVRWPVAAALLIGVFALLVAYAPAERRPLRWISVGTSLAVAAWLGTSGAVGWYVTSVADYGSIYGALATVVILLTYLYLATSAFLTGVELDDLLQDRARRRARTPPYRSIRHAHARLTDGSRPGHTVPASGSSPFQGAHR